MIFTQTPRDLDSYEEIFGKQLLELQGSFFDTYLQK